MNFTWWVDLRGRRRHATSYEGGFLGLDNIGPLRPRRHLPVDGAYLAQS